jgi:hypothetical protein
MVTPSRRGASNASDAAVSERINVRPPWMVMLVILPPIGRFEQAFPSLAEAGDLGLDVCAGPCRVAVAMVARGSV